MIDFRRKTYSNFSWIKKFTFLIILVHFFFGCAKTLLIQKPVTGNYIENVPFYPQEAYQCGPASLAGVLNYWGIRVSPHDIAHEIYNVSAKGTLTLDMKLYAEKMGLRAVIYRGGLADIKEKIDHGYPLIILVDLGFWIFKQNHFMVVIGYDANGVIVNSGKEKEKFIYNEEFLRLWKRTNFWSLLITPK